MQDFHLSQSISTLCGLLLKHFTSVADLSTSPTAGVLTVKKSVKEAKIKYSEVFSNSKHWALRHSTVLTCCFTLSYSAGMYFL